MLAVSTSVIAAGISFLIPNSYRSTATILPESDQSKLGGLSGLSDLASIAGVSLGGEKSLVKLYPAIIRSESVLRNVILASYEISGSQERMNLVEYWDIDEKSPERNFEVAFERLNEDLSVSMDSKTNIVSISLETEDPLLSAGVVGGIVRGLDEFMRTRRTTNASEQRKWVEQRTEEVRQDLKLIEESLKTFREKNRRVVDSPKLLMEQERLIREAEINAALYIELKKQFELARIEEVKNVPIINVLDPPRPAAEKDGPRRGIMVVMAAFLSVLLYGGVLIVDLKYGGMLRIFAANVREAITSSETGQ